jgi:hypothetical protein
MRKKGSARPRGGLGFEHSEMAEGELMHFTLSTNHGTCREFTLDNTVPLTLN